jgi:hypothetical protein
LTNPDTPINIEEFTAYRTAKSIGLAFEEGPSNGGAPILDYRITYTTDYDNSQIIASAIAGSPYLAVNLYTGSTYSFIVESRNTFGYSALSAPVQIYCAFVPN